MLVPQPARAMPSDSPARTCGLPFLRQCEEVLRVAQLLLLGLAGRSSRSMRVLADRLEHPEALVGVPEEALVDERLQRVEIGLRDLLGRLERAPTREDCEPREDALLLGRQELVAPFDRRAKGALALGQVPGTAGQKRQALLEAAEDLARAKAL